MTHRRMTPQERDKQRGYREAGKQHVIAQITFQGHAPGEDGSYPMAPVECSCGTWSGVSSEFQEHRREHGARLTGTAMVGRERTASPWR